MTRSNESREELHLPSGSASSTITHKGENIEVTYSYSSGSGSSSGGGLGGWRRCNVGECFGEAIAAGRCFGHLDDGARVAYVNAADGGASRHISMNGNRVDRSCLDALKRSEPGKRRVFRVGISFCAAEIETVLDLSEFEFHGELNLKRVHALASVKFCRAAFKKRVSLEFARFEEQHVDFVEADFCDDVSIVCVTAPKPVQLNFGSSRFRSKFVANGVQADLRLEEAKFSGRVELDDAKFRFLTFRGAEFSGDVTLRNSTALSIHGQRAVFRAGAVVDAVEVEAGCFLERLELDHRARFRLSARELNLSDSLFRSGGHFDVGRASTKLSGLRTDKALAIVGIEGQPMATISSLDGADGASLSFSHVDLSGCRFHRVHGLAAIGLAPSVRFARVPRWWLTGRRFIRDEQSFRASRGGLARWVWSASDGSVSGKTGVQTAEQAIALARQLAESQKKLEDSTGVSGPGDVLMVYQALRRAAERQALPVLADDFFYGEMEMARAESGFATMRGVLLHVYWAVSGYGLRVLRPLVWACACIAAGATVLQAAGFKHPSPGLLGWVDGVLFSLRSFVPGIRPIAEVTRIGSTVEIVLGIVGPTLTAFIILAVRNRVRRVKGG